MVTGIYLYLTVSAIFDHQGRFTSQVCIYPHQIHPHTRTVSKNIISLRVSKHIMVATIKKMMWTFPMIPLNYNVAGGGHFLSFSLSFK